MPLDPVAAEISEGGPEQRAVLNDQMRQLSEAMAELPPEAATKFP